jgi:hypothetical protein
MAEHPLVGSDYTTPDLVAKVTGRAKYAEDYRADGMLWCKLLLSPMPHARVLNINTTAALAMPGQGDSHRRRSADRANGGERALTTNRSTKANRSSRARSRRRADAADAHRAHRGHLRAAAVRDRSRW